MNLLIRFERKIFIPTRLEDSTCRIKYNHELGLSHRWKAPNRYTILVQEMRQLYDRQGVKPIIEAKAAKRPHSLEKWQSRCDSPLNGRWTYRPELVNG